jgi:hypothetical protein
MDYIIPPIILDKMIGQEYMEIVNMYVGIPTLVKDTVKISVEIKKHKKAPRQ